MFSAEQIVKMEFPHTGGKSKMRARSGSGVRLEYYQRLVYKTILKYQVWIKLI